MSFGVFVKLSDNGARTVPINGLKSTDTVAVLIEKLAGKEGVSEDGTTLVFRGKQLSDKNEQLGKRGIRSQSTIYATFRVNGGGAQQSNLKDEKKQQSSLKHMSSSTPSNGSTKMRRFDEKKAKKLGIKVKNTHCMIGISDGCYDNSVLKLSFAECDHTYCADCVFSSLKNAVDTNKKTFMSCCDGGCGAKFDIDAIFIAAALTDEEITKFEEQLSNNYLARIPVCPNDKCRAYLLMDSVNTNRVQCRECKGSWFCKKCNVEWPANRDRENNYMVCGNPDCITSAKIVRKDYGIEKNVPSTRICKECRRYVEWVDNCKHSTCQNCGYKFCFVCLKEGHSCSLHEACKVKE